MSLIYQPGGKALEYADLACSVYLRCTHSCLYCYCPKVLHVSSEEYFKKPEERSRFLGELSRDARRLAGDKRRVLLSFIGDCYQPADDEYRLTRQAIEILHSRDIPVTILTKGGHRAMRDFDLLGSDDAFATTLTCLSNEDSRKWEPGAALPQERIDSLKEAWQLGIPTWVSLEPVIFPEQVKDIIAVTHRYCGYYKIGMMNYHPHGKTIDWKKFGWQLKHWLDAQGIKYYFKQDLLREMGAGTEFKQTYGR